MGTRCEIRWVSRGVQQMDDGGWMAIIVEGESKEPMIIANMAKEFLHGCGLGLSRFRRRRISTCCRGTRDYEPGKCGSKDACFVPIAKHNAYKHDSSAQAVSPASGNTTLLPGKKSLMCSQ